MVYLINGGSMEIKADDCRQEGDFILFAALDKDGKTLRNFMYVNVRIVDTITFKERE